MVVMDKFCEGHRQLHEEQVRHMWWKLFTAYFAVTTLYFELAPGSLDAWDILDLLIVVLGIIGMIGFSFKKPLLWPVFWKVYLPINILWNLWHPDSRTVPGIPGVPFWLVVAIGVTAAIPFYAAIFVYGFRQRKLWNTTTNRI